MSAARKSAGAATAKPAPAKGVRMCRVTIGYEHFLLPVAQGLKLIEVMEAALQLETDWATPDSKYYITGVPRLAYHSALPSQIVERPAAHMAANPD
ncbi:hypothetical protein LNV08_11795 [Paucibacter sp. TC2R-5]|uniref:hypothetical protein n=1 Tax=Paucibacter sp. TC2R-5 TaxID=2893555 RepID=UPI0021E38133|nr:hypothetical protein [Paucibacter sp. TC2R-5]MCV2359652.1 hypothetical protein [Paucibacter sp. TC2R-5]